MSVPRIVRDLWERNVHPGTTIGNVVTRDMITLNDYLLWSPIDGRIPLEVRKLSYLRLWHCVLEKTSKANVFETGELSGSQKLQYRDPLSYIDGYPSDLELLKGVGVQRHETAEIAGTHGNRSIRSGKGERSR